MGGRTFRKYGRGKDKRKMGKASTVVAGEKATEPADSGRYNRSMEKAAAKLEQSTIECLRQNLPLRDILPQLCTLQRFLDMKEPKTSLGFLNFPPELMTAILGELNIESLLALSKVNRNGVRAVMHTTDLKKVYMSC